MWVVILNAKGQAPYFRGASSLPHLFFIPQTTINRNRNGVKTWREIIGIWILRIERRSRRGTPAGIARLKSPRGLACIPRRSTTNCNEAIPEKWTRRNAKFTARSGRKRWFGKTSSEEAAAGRRRQTAGAEREVLTVTNFEKLAQSPAGLGAFLRGLPILEGPWDDEFHKRYCRKCPSTTRYKNKFSIFSHLLLTFANVGCNIKCERTSPLFSGSFEPSAFIFYTTNHDKPQ